MKKETRNIALMVLGIVIITCFPFVKEGLCAYYPDLMYHLLRIEGVKDALMTGEYPTYIYTNFFDGYGYGSPMFYPDIFLLIPAILRMFSIQPITVWKIFAVIITITAAISTYFSIKYICRNAKWSIAGTFMIMLSQFYLADLHLRAGISEYIAFIFIPILIAGIYDFFMYEGKRTYLLGIAFAGLLLSHSIMTFIGIVITIVVFVRMLFVKKECNYLCDKDRVRRLIITAIGTELLVSYYLFPMLEQMSVLELRYTEPWAHIGSNTQPFSSFFRLIGRFSTIAYIGIGIPILPLMLMCIFLKKPSNRWAKAFLYGGIGLFLITTDLVPWDFFENTIFNMIQFTYRFWPYAIFFVVTGIVLILSENEYKILQKHRNLVFYVIIFSALFSGIFQNRMTAWATSEETRNITEDYLAENSNYVGAGEWMPLSVTEEVENLEATDKVQTNLGSFIELESTDCGYSFKQQESATVYELPLIYYKGYEAWKYSENGEKINLAVESSKEGLVKVADSLEECGEVYYIEYTGTVIQKVLLVVSFATLFLISAIGIKRWILQRK